MSLAEFIACHGPVLERDEVKHGLILGAFARAVADDAGPVSYWTLGGPGCCAIKMGPYPIVLGALGEPACRAFAELTAHTDYAGVTGPDTTARWFADRARELGAEFLEPVAQQIYAIAEQPRYPAVSGHARVVTGEDATLFADWRLAFQHDAVPHDPVPTRAELERAAAEGRFLFWIDKDQPVSMAGIVRRLKHSAAITGVYTPAALRGRGYAGSVTAAAVACIHAEGRAVACLYADLANPASNRCYRKIGFKPVCRSLHFHRRDRVPGAPSGRGNPTGAA